MRERVIPKAIWIALLSTFLAALLIPLWAGAADEEEHEDKYKTYGAAEARKVTEESVGHWTTADHSRHVILQQEFTSGPEVTKACLSCHNQASLQIHKTIHWTWKCPYDAEGNMGKYANTFNNFCISVPSNEPRCTSCHIGYGWKDKNFDLSSQENVDCLVCHDQTGTYMKFPTMAGNPPAEPTPFEGTVINPPDWNKVAQSVGRPSRNNCGECHFKGGGGDGVKHGDLDTSLLTPSKKLDVHMAADGGDFDCVRCHTTEAHKIAGRCYKHPAAMTDKSLIDDDQVTRITCYSCHTDRPHEPGSKLNDHTDKVSCQACHIPTFARELPTKMYWDWSTAGKMKDGKPFAEDGPLGKPSYDSKKGDFVWAKFVEPEYFWFNGTLDYMLLNDTIEDLTKPVQINTVIGSRDDPRSRIYPFKVHRGKQPYDSVNKTFVIPHLFGKDDAAYWKNYDWGKAIKSGQEYWGSPFSGQYGFVETEYFYQTTHMVAPAEDALACEACHSKDSRLVNLAGFYMPGRDSFGWLNAFGWVLVIGTILGVIGHGFLRIVSRKS